MTVSKGTSPNEWIGASSNYGRWPLTSMGDPCDDLGLDAYLNTTEWKKEFRENMLAQVRPLILAQALARSFQTSQREKEREEDRALYIWVKEQVLQKENQRSTAQGFERSKGRSGYTQTLNQGKRLRFLSLASLTTCFATALTLRKTK